MADELGAVRRTPRPTGDRQTAETVAQLPRGATNAPTPVSTDTGNGTDDLSPEVAAALVEQHGPELEALADVARHGLDELREKLADAFQGVPGSVVFGHVHTTDNDMQAFLELPDCTACGGTGKDTNGSPFETPYAVHFAGPPVKAEGRQRQLCMWCGHVLSDLPSRKGETSPSWPAGALVRIEDGLDSVVPYDGGELPPGCCALPDDEQYSRTASSGPATQGIPDEAESTLDGCICTENRCDYDDHDNPPTDYLCVPCGQLTEGTPCLANGPADEPEHCGKHVPGTSGNRCLLRAGHTGDHSDEFEPAPCTCLPDCCLGEGDPPNRCEHCATIDGELPCPIADAGPDEAQETRATDWPAEETDHG